MIASYRLSLANYRSALALHYRSKGRWRSPLNLFILFPAIGLFYFIGDMIHAFRHDSVGSDRGQLILSLCMMALPLLYIYSTGKQFKSMFARSSTDTSLSIDINDQRILTEMPGFTETTILWKAVVKFAQNEKVTLFYLAEVRFLFVPTNAFSVEQRTELRDIVTRHGVKSYLC